MVKQPVQKQTYLASDIIRFREGLPGFPERTQFVIVQEEDISPFEWLLSVGENNLELRFAILNPVFVYPNYEPEISDAYLRDLGVTSPEDVLLYVIVTINDDMKKTTANLSGPVVINKHTGMARQVVLDSDRYSTKEPLVRD
ncbi:flagellar assembly protein FliW [Chitinivibrio alkaliphilus]|uniref:Flagellar assembly factor FliW n=1 Tax=Chitinivibrio alkaliphilus ACht1 TaxID=1313304 RepID=U7DBH7_9BACT|nr:flagellar assembly protein FliW [Chitinivibrio alkaliphilus]ERP39372.1 flagellar assembly protein FliW [Chitinivibrio alkaliphilus ACht1]